MNLNTKIGKVIILIAIMTMGLSTFGQNEDPNNEVNAVNPYVRLHVSAYIPSPDKQGEITATITWCRDGVPATQWMSYPTQTQTIPGFTGWNDFDIFSCALRGIVNEVHYVVKVTNIFTNKVILKDCGIVYFITSATDVYLNIETWNGCFGEPLEITPESPY